MSRFLSLSSQRSSCGRLTRCVSCLESLCAGDGEVVGMNEVGLALSILRAFSIGCSSVEPLDSLAEIFSFNECDERDGNVKMVKGRALGIASCLIRWEKHLSANDLWNAMNKQANPRYTELSPIEKTVSLTVAQTMKLLIQASDLGDSFTVFILGMCSWFGHAVPQNKEESVKMYQQAANLSNSQAMFNLAVCYDKGDGVAQDKSKAIHLYQKASDLGNTNAMVNLGICYEKGDGVAQDKSKAIQLYQQASDLGHTDAMFNLGTVDIPLTAKSSNCKIEFFPLTENCERFGAGHRKLY